MSFRAILWAFEKDLPPIPKLVLVVLASHASTKDGACFPRIRTIAREASLSERTVYRHLPVLEQQELVRIERRFLGKARQPHRYWLNCPCAARDRHEQAGGAADRRAYDSLGGTKKHYLNHKSARQGNADRTARPSGNRTGQSRMQMAEQSAQCELARRLGPQGWEILATFDQEVPRLCARLRNGTLSGSELLDLRARYIEQGGQRRSGA